MQILGLVLTGTFLAVLGAVLLALVLPIRLWLYFDSASRPMLTIFLQPLGRIGPRISLARETGKKRAAKPPDKPGKLRWARIEGAAVWRLFSSVLRAIHLEEAQIDVAFGLGDPAETGQAFGLLTAALQCLHPVTADHVDLRPVFDRACLEGSGHACLAITPAALLPPLVRFGWSLRGAPA